MKKVRFPNLSLLAGIFLASHLSPCHAVTHYVNIANSTPAPPYTNWATAATVIQDAVDVTVAGEEILVTN